MRSVAAALVVFAVASSLAAQTPVRIPTPGTANAASTPGAMLGRVIDGMTGDPIRDAVVTLSGRSGVGPMLTDANGRFAFDGLARGALTVAASKGGHYGGLYGQRRPTGPAQLLQLGDGERMMDVVLRLWKFAAIGGTVLDEAGEPVVGLSVFAYPKTFVSGRPVINSGSGILARTDDRGVFRIARLMPGAYVVGLPLSENAVPLSMVEASTIASYADSPNARSLARGLNAAGMDGDLPGSTYLQVIDGQARSYWSNTAVPPPPDVEGRILAYAATYFSNASAPGLGQDIVVRPGDDRTAVDFRLRLVPTVRVSGRVVGPDGPVANVALRLIPGAGNATTDDLPVARTLSDARGVYTFLAVTPGQYEARVTSPVVQSTAFMQDGIMTRSAATMSETAWWTNTSVSVGTTDVKDLPIALHRGVAVSGRLEVYRLAAKPTADQLRRIGIRLELADGRGIESGVGLARVDDLGRFQTNEMPPGKYVVRVTSAPSGWSAMVGSRDVSIVPIDVVDRGIDNLIIALGEAPAELSGTVRTTFAGVEPDTIVLAFSSDRATWTNYGRTPRHMLRVRADRDGSFSLTGLPPGDYLVAAVREDIAPDDWTDPAFLAALTGTASSVRLVAGRVATVSVQLRTVR